MAIRLFSLLLLFLMLPTAWAQDIRYLDRRDVIADRLVQLENEIRMLRAETRQLGERPVRLPSVAGDGNKSMFSADGFSAKSDFSPENGPIPQELVSLDELRGEMKRFACKKGDFTLVPHGYLWSNMVYTTQRTTAGTYTLYVHSASKSNKAEFLVDARNSRLGIDVGGPQMVLFEDAKSGGLLEIDFQNSDYSSENRAIIQLRHAYWEVKNDRYRLLLGQTWDVVSPLFPGVWNAGTCWDAGNLGFRRAQLRGERYFDFSETSLATAQLSMNVQIFDDDFPKCCGEPSNWPIIEGRIAWTIGDRGEKDRPITLGLSGHIGEEQFDHLIAGTNLGRRTWSGNLDMHVPLTDRIRLQGELFTGENLGAFLGNIGQGINPITLDTISGVGGWFDIGYDWTPRLHSHFGYSLDDPVDGDLASGQRKYNQCYFGNLTLDLTESFQIAGEVSSWRTLYVDRLPGNALRFEFVARYGF